MSSFEMPFDVEVRAIEGQEAAPYFEVLGTVRVGHLLIHNCIRVDSYERVFSYSRTSREVTVTNMDYFNMLLHRTHDALAGYLKNAMQPRIKLGA